MSGSEPALGWATAPATGTGLLLDLIVHLYNIGYASVTIRPVSIILYRNTPNNNPKNAYAMIQMPSRTT